MISSLVEDDKATSKNYFLRLGAEDFSPEKVMEKTAYFVYGGFFIMHLWGERFAPRPKGEFLEVPDKIQGWQSHPCAFED